MSRTYRRFVVAGLAALLLGAVPAAAAPATGWSLFDSFSPLEWIRGLWAETGSEINPWGRPTPAGEGSASPGVPRAIWAEEGASISPWVQPAPAQHNTGSSISPRGLQ